MKTLLYIGNKLAKHGINQTSIETLGEFLEREGFQLFYASEKKNKVLRMLDMILKTLYYSKKADYVLIDTYSTYNFWYALIISQLCRILNLKYIPKLHGGDLPKRLQNNPKLCQLIFSNSYLNIAPSGYLLDAFREKGFTKTIYVPNTIELIKYEFKKREVIEPKLLWVRSFSMIYNPEMAIQVLKELKKEYPNAELCMVGPDHNGNLNKMQQLAIQLNLKVKFTGRLSKEVWVELSKEYNIFINTTHFDNTPVSVIEAMALGLPVVSTNVGGIPYLLENNKTALLVNDNDVSQMVASIKKLIIENDLRTFIVKNALELVQDFDSEKVKLDWFKILK